MNLAIRFGYDGQEFDGFAIQNIPSPPHTVMGDIIKVLNDLDETADPKITNGSRTDKGVSATGNVMVIRDPPLEPIKVIDALNRLVPGCVFTHYAVVDEKFHPGFALSRSYEYYFHDPQNKYEIDVIRKSIEPFKGEHDFRNYSKRDPTRSEPDNTVRTIKEFKVVQEDGRFVFYITANGFLWQMVRRVVGHILEGAKDGKHLTAEDVAKGPAGTPMVEPEFLVLTGIAYDHDPFADCDYTYPWPTKNRLEHKLIEYSWRYELIKRLGAKSPLKK